MSNTDSFDTFVDEVMAAIQAEGAVSADQLHETYGEQVDEALAVLQERDLITISREGLVMEAS